MNAISHDVEKPDESHDYCDVCKHFLPIYQIESDSKMNSHPFIEWFSSQTDLADGYCALHCRFQDAFEWCEKYRQRTPFVGINSTEMLNALAKIPEFLNDKEAATRVNSIIPIAKRMGAATFEND